MEIPKFLKRLSDKSFLMHIHLKPNSKKQDILAGSPSESEIVVLVRSKPIQNKANKELINLLKKRLKISSNQIKIVSGLKSSSKVVELSYNSEIKWQDIYNALIS